jgi:hypothetical protein
MTARPSSDHHRYSWDATSRAHLSVVVDPLEAYVVDQAAENRPTSTRCTCSIPPNVRTNPGEAGGRGCLNRQSGAGGGGDRSSRSGHPSWPRGAGRRTRLPGSRTSRGTDSADVGLDTAHIRHRDPRMALTQRSSGSRFSPARSMGERFHTGRIRIVWQHALT